MEHVGNVLAAVGITSLNVPLALIGIGVAVSGAVTGKINQTVHNAFSRDKSVECRTSLKQNWQSTSKWA